MDTKEKEPFAPEEKKAVTNEDLLLQLKIMNESINKSINENTASINNLANAIYAHFDLKKKKPKKEIKINLRHINNKKYGLDSSSSSSFRSLSVGK